MGRKLIARLASCLLVLSLVVMFSSQAAAATFSYSGNQLIGANGIAALGETWNVTFNGGSFDDVNNTYGISNPFPTYDESLALSEALALDMSSGLGGTLDPEDVNGCSNFNVGCGIVTPYMFFTHLNDPTENMRVTGPSVLVEPSRAILGGYTSTTMRSTDYDNYSYAVWEASSVPLPGAVWLLGSGLFGLVGFRRKKRA